MDEKEKIRLLQKFINELTEENDPLRNLLKENRSENYKLIASCTACGAPQGVFNDEDELRLKIAEQRKCLNCGTLFGFLENGKIWNLRWEKRYTKSENTMPYHKNNFRLNEDVQLKSLEMCIQRFKQEHDPKRTVFVMMKFSGGDIAKDTKLEKLYTSIKLELDKYGFDAVRADEKDYSDTGYLWDNIQIYLNGCEYGIAVLENLYSDEMNPNVALEYGYMLAKGKKVLLLKEKSFKNINADILGKIWKEFDIDNPTTVKKAIQSWMIDLGIPQIKSL